MRASPLQLTCRQDQLAVAVCNLQKYPQELPLKYQVCKPPTTTNIDMFVSVLLKLVDVLFFFLYKMPDKVIYSYHTVLYVHVTVSSAVFSECAVGNYMCCVSILSGSLTWLLISCRSLGVLWRSRTTVHLVRSSAGTSVENTRETPTAECLRTSQVLLILLFLLLPLV